MSEALESFNENGFYIARGLIEKFAVDEALVNLKKTFDDQLKVIGHIPQSKIYDSMRLLHAKDIERYKKTVGSLWRKISVYELCHNKNILNFVRDNFEFKDVFIPGGQVVHIQARSLQIPNGYFGLVAHQDFPSVQGSLDGIVVWIPLVDIDNNRFPLEVVPRSHKQGVLPSNTDSLQTWEINSSSIKEEEFIPVLCEVGDVVFMSNFTVHRSSSQGDDRLRLACSTRLDNGDEYTFIERCYPTAYKRSVHREPLFPELFNNKKID
jgi:ectoine hydroxylase-related dioxygenase (phytanoyl-CoA dioxygenase family)